MGMKTRPALQFFGVGLVAGALAVFLCGLDTEHTNTSLQLGEQVCGVLAGCCMLAGIALGISSLCERVWRGKHEDPPSK